MRTCPSNRKMSSAKKTKTKKRRRDAHQQVVKKKAKKNVSKKLKEEIQSPALKLKPKKKKVKKATPFKKVEDSNAKTAKKLVIDASQNKIQQADSKILEYDGRSADTKSSANQKSIEPTANSMTNEIKQTGKKRARRRKKAKTKRANLTHEEQTRVTNQKRMQKLVRKLISKGTSKKDIRKAKIQFRRQLQYEERTRRTAFPDQAPETSTPHGANTDTSAPSVPSAPSHPPHSAPRAVKKMDVDTFLNKMKLQKNKKSSRANKGAEWKERNPLSDAQMKGRNHNIVIVPVTWKHKEEEKAKILLAADRLKEFLSRYKLDVWIDSRTKFTPGQKFCYWEHTGVRLRIEIGPKEVEAGTCVLSVATDTPGEVSTRIAGLRQNSKELLKQIHAKGKFPWLKID